MSSRLSIVLVILAAGCDGQVDDPASTDGTSGREETSGTAATGGAPYSDAASSAAGTPGSTSAPETGAAVSGTTASSDPGTDGSTAAGGSTRGSASTGSPPAVNLFENPSLELWAEEDYVNGYPEGWFDCGSTELGVEAVPDACDGALPPAADGERYARGYSGERFGQVVQTEPGTTYTVAFDYAAVEGCFGGAPSSSWEVIIGGGVVDTTPADQGTDAWATWETSFVASETSTEICFRIPTGAGGIDALSVRAQ